MKKISLLVLVCMILSLAFASCDMVKTGSGSTTTTPTEHEHAYGTTWSFDAANHYHACTCGSQSDVAAHADGNNDGACDTCAIILDNTHVFDSAWTTDATNHWHAALCGHDVVDAKAAHTANEFGLCSVCGVKVNALVIETVADAIEVALKQDYAAKAGSVFYHQVMFDYEYEYYYDANNLVYFEKSEGYLHVTNLAEASETWYYAVGDDSVWSAYNNAGVVVANPNEYSVDNLNGYYFDGAILDYSDDAKAYGVADLLDALYFLGENSIIAVESEVLEVEGETVYSFTFGTPYWEGVHVVKVAFTLDQNSYYVNKAYVGVADVIEGEGVTTVYKTDENGDFVYDDNWDPIVDSVTLDENVELDFSDKYYEITQGEENAAPSPEDSIMSSFDIKDAEGNPVSGTLSVSKGTPVVLDILPNGGNPNLDPVKVTITDEEGNETWGVYASVENGQITVNGYTEGTYIVTLASANHTITLTVVVTAPAVESIEVGVYDNTEYDYAAQTELTISVGGSVDFKALVNDGANAGYTYAIVGNGDGYSVEEEWGCHVATFTVVGTYTITVTSVEDDTKTASLTVVVEENNIDFATLLTGTYQTVDSMVTITVVFNPTDATSGTITVSATHPRNGDISTTFTYLVENNTFAATAVDGGSDFFQNVYVSADGKLFVTADFWDYELAPYVESNTGDAEEVTGSNSYMGMVPTLNNETKTYVTTVDAFALSFFQVQYDGTTVYNITVTFEGDVICYSGNPRAPMMLLSGGYVTLDDINSNALIWFENVSETDNATVTFTLTFTAI